LSIWPQQTIIIKKDIDLRKHLKEIDLPLQVKSSFPEIFSHIDGGIISAS
jgi:hypothetical protein